MTSKERVLRAIEHRGPDRVPMLSPIPAFSDFSHIMVYPASDWQPKPGYAPNLHRALYLIGNWKWKEFTPSKLRDGWLLREDEFGCEWEAPEPENVGEANGHPLSAISQFDSMNLPDPHRPERYETFTKLTKILARDKFILGDLGNGIGERVRFLRGFEGIMEDYALRPEAVGEMMDRLIDEWYIGLIDELADRGCHGVMSPDDWGMQDRLMISPSMWRKIVKPRYARVIDAVHNRGMKFFLHSCGAIQAILDDFIEIGLDVLQKDDIECLGSANMEKKYAGKLCFLTSLDLQRTLPWIPEKDISREVKKLIARLGKQDGGIMCYTYMQPTAVGVSWLKMGLMCYYFALHGKYGKSPALR